jgi:hypothetical protein
MMSKLRVYPGAKIYKKPKRLNVKVIPRRKEQCLKHCINDHHKKIVLCEEGCCIGDEILCISIPCPIVIVLNGLQLTLELPCIRLTSPVLPSLPKPDVPKREYYFSNSYTSTVVQTEKLRPNILFKGKPASLKK